MSIFILSVITVFTTILLVILGRSRERSSFYFRITVLFLLLWTLSILFTELDVDHERILFWSRLSFFFPIFIALPLHPFTYYLPISSVRQEMFKPINFIVSSVFLITGLIFAALSFTPLILADVVDLKSSFGVLQPAYSIYMLSSFSYFILVLYLTSKKAKGRMHAQIQMVLLGIGTSSLLAIVTNLVLPIWGLREVRFLGPLGLIVFFSATAYAILAHRLFDIRVIIKRTLVYSTLLIFVLVTYALVVFFFSQIFGSGGVTFGVRSFVPNIIAAILIAFGFDPLRQWLSRVTDKYLFKGEYDPQEVGNSLAKVLSNVVNLDEALDSMMSVVTRDMRISRVATLIVRTVDKDTVVKRIKSTGFSNVIKLEDRPIGLLLEYFTKHPEMVVSEELKQAMENKAELDPALVQVMGQLEQFQAGLALPLVVSGKIIGILFVGEKLSGDSFSGQDLDTMELIGSQTALSIEKAKFYEEDKLKSEFISIASHELLTPTAAIEGYLSMLLDEKMTVPDDQKKQYIQRAYDSSRRLADLVKDLLSISRIESGRMKVVPVPMDLLAIVSQAVDELKVTAKEKGLSLELTKPTGTIPRVVADPDRVMQICINLINNSIKYTPKGSVKVALAVKKNMVITSVTDTGIGISKTDQQHLFEKFHRIDNPATAGIMGTGLGLYIVKNIVTLLSGEVTIESEAGKGSTFTFSLPIAR